ncbi:efflux RND transporter periplasmic adaptor subunit [Candidatus Woesebacteria bacterium]|nr:efflux RND transporter periplasmic adaptor subunit [Candidatus Woesebacteria bacterium]
MINWIKTHKILSIVIVVVLAFGIYRFTQKDNVEYTEYTVTKSSINETFELSGKVVAGSSATLRFGAGGLVTYLGAKEGDVIKKWQTLASVDTRQLQKTIEQKLNLYAIQRGTFDQTIDDADNSVPDGDLARTLSRLLEKNQYQLDNTVKDVEYLDLSRTLSRLSSPIAGVLVHSPIDTANVQVSPTDTWMVVDPTSLYFSADLDETDLKRVSVGQKVIITLDAFVDKEYESSVLSISYSPKETSAGTTYEVKLSLPKDLLSDLRLGLNGTAAIILSEKESVKVLPSSALSGSNGSTTVTIKNGKKYEEKNVETGVENDGMVEIVSGLGDNDHVYVKK